MIFGDLRFRQSRFVRALCAGVLALLVTSVALHGQTPKRNIFDDDPGPPPTTTTPGMKNPPAPQPAAPVVAPAQGLVPGILGTMYEGSTTDSKVKEHHITPNLGLTFQYPAINGYIPMSFSFQGVINVTRATQGQFHFECTGDSEVTIDGNLVSAVRLDDPANTFEHPINLTVGLHPFSGKVMKLHGTGAVQHLALIWRPFAGTSGKLPKEWCWHSKTDEPADLVDLRREGSGEGGGAPQGNPPPGGVVWIRAGTPRPVDPAAKPQDVLSGVVLASYAGHDLDHLGVFGVAPMPSFNLTVTPTRIDAQGFYNESVRLSMAIRIDEECQCAFDCKAPGLITITVDQHLATRTGNGAEGQVRQAISLKPGYHALEVTLTKVSAPEGMHEIALLWQVNNAALSKLPSSAWNHFRYQELYADSVASGGAGQPAAPQPFQPQQTPGQPAVPAPLVKNDKLPLPDAASLAKATADLRQNPGAWMEPGTAQQAMLLLNAGAAAHDDPVACYVLLDRAEHLAQSAGATNLAFQAIDRLAGQFTVDVPRLKVQVLAALGNRRAADASNRDVLLESYNQAMAAASYGTAADAATMLLADARAANIQASVVVATDLLNRANAANAELEKVKPALARLADNRDDPAANLAAAKFYCFTARNWESGVPALARCGDPVLSWLGHHEATAAQGPQEQLTLANGWWDAADGQPSPIATVMRERAAQWYALAQPNLAGLSRRVAQRRVALVPNSASLPSPLTGAATAVASRGPIPGTPAPGPVPTPAPAPASTPPYTPPQPPAPVARNPHFPNFPGPLLVVVDRTVVNPDRIFMLVGRITAESGWTVPEAAVTVMVADSPPKLITFTAGALANDQARKKEIEDALRSQAAPGDLVAALTTGLKDLPGRLIILTDINIDLDKTFAVVNARDPSAKMQRSVQMWCAKADHDRGMEKMRTISTAYHSSSGLATDR